MGKKHSLLCRLFRAVKAEEEAAKAAAAEAVAAAKAAAAEAVAAAKAAAAEEAETKNAKEVDVKPSCIFAREWL